MALTKAEISDTLADHNGYSRKGATDKVETLLEIIKRTLASGEDVLVSRFGKFCVSNKAKRKGGGTAIGDDMVLRPKRLVAFKCSGKLRKKVNTNE
jgi:integration host factor subunit alpha